MTGKSKREIREAASKRRAPSVHFVRDTLLPGAWISKAPKGGGA